MRDIIAISSIKGGVGKSVTAIMLGFIFSKRYKTLLIDIDSQASITSYFLPYFENKIDIREYNIYEVLKSKKSFMSIVHEITDDLHFAPSHIKLSQFSGENIIGQEYKLKTILTPYFDEYDYILIDTPPSVNKELINSLMIATKVVIPLPAELWAIESYDILKSKMQEIISAYQKQDFKSYYVIQTLYEENRKIKKEFFYSLQQLYQEYVPIKIHRSAAIQKMITYRLAPQESERYYNEYLKVAEVIEGIENIKTT